MGRLGSDDARHLAVAGQYCDPLRQGHLVPPASQGDELDESFLGDQLDHEADFVHVTGQHYARVFAGSALDAYDASHAVLLDGGNGLQVSAHDLSDL